MFKFDRDTILLLALAAFIVIMAITMLITRASKKRRLVRENGIAAKPLTVEKTASATAGKGKSKTDKLGFDAAWTD